MLKNEEFISHMYFKVGGEELSADVIDNVLYIEVDDNLNLPDSFTIGVRDPELKLLNSDSFALGKSIEIFVPRENREAKLMDGEITAIEPRFPSKGDPMLVVRGYDRCHRLNREKKSGSFIQMTDSDIATKIAKKAGFTPNVNSTREVHAYVFQDNQTDWEFLWDRAQRIGFRVFVEGKELHFKKAPKDNEKVPVLEWGNNLQEFNPCINTAQQVGEVIVRGWDPKAKKDILGRATKSGDMPKLDKPEQGGQAAEKAFNVAGKEIIVDRPVFTQIEADALAQSICDQIGQDFITADGICAGTPEVCAGSIVELTCVGDRLNGRYRVNHALHRYDVQGYTTEFTIGGRHNNTLGELLSVRKTEKHSPMVGVVTNNKDPDGLCRVKVKLPSRGNQELDWARVVAPGAGNQKGLMWLPDVNDEVLVLFEHDDIHRPFVIGGLWNRTDTPEVKSDTVVKDGRTIRVIIGAKCDITIKSDGKLSLEAKDDLIIKGKKVRIN
jgi:phage protein D